MTERPSPIARAQAKADQWVRRGQQVYDQVTGIRRVAVVIRTMDRFNGAGGGLTAGGLAYSTLFTLTAGFLFIVGVAGLLIKDDASREELINQLAGAFPPLEPLIRPALEGIAQGAVPVTVISFVGALWGLNGLFAALESSFSRVFQSARRRDAIGNRLWALGVMIAFAVSVGFIAVLAGIAAVDGLVERIIRFALGPVGLSIATALLYRFLPTSRPSWRAVVAPAIIVGTLIALWSAIFGTIAPVLFRWLSIYGPVATVLAALIWLQYLFQMLLLGAGWVAVRAEDESLPVARDVPPDDASRSMTPAEVPPPAPATPDPGPPATPDPGPPATPDPRPPEPAQRT